MMNSPIRIPLGALALMLPLAPLAAQEPPQTASQAVVQFIQAAADSNLVRMSQLFGSEDGSARKTGEPADFQKRMVIMQAMLRGAKVRALGEVRTKDEDRISVTTEIAKGDCKVVLPVTAVKSGDGWLVNRFDLPTVWEGINTPCPGTE